jgi:hypothetical protein
MQKIEMVGRKGRKITIMRFDMEEEIEIRRLG